MNYGNSLQSKLHQMLPQDSSADRDSKVKTIKTPSLKIVKNTVVFGNSVYQIRNICTVELADLTETYAINQTVPTWYWSLVGLGFILLFFYGIGIVILIFAGWLFWQHSNLDKSRTDEEYGLRIGMSSGEAVILTSSKKEFVIDIIVTLYDIINKDDAQALEVNFERFNIEKIEDKSIKIEKSYGSSVVSGKVGGDVVNMISRQAK
ncbi:MAG: hypothetical protein F6J93_04090 [Oscillatoria sp. SIO1A7]|nr:hypothetical protein [Oscillatoria sp. SIO1A7]